MPIIFFDDKSPLAICAAVVAVILGKCAKNLWIITHVKRRNAKEQSKK